MSTARRDKLIELQKIAQKRWEEEKCFEEDAPAPGDPDEKQEKHFVTFPYPYMNGMLHLGHTFSLSKTEFSMGYERLKGKKTLWPFGFHCTGMPIQAAADNLRREIIGMYNELHTTDEEKQAALDAEKAAAQQDEEEVVKDPTKFAGKKTKAVAKKGKGSGWQVLESMDIEREDVPKFVDPVHWLQYFPPIAKQDLIEMGVKVDWRRRAGLQALILVSCWHVDAAGERSFITTNINGYYDSFIKWQFYKLKKLDKVNFGKRYSVFSPCDNQICADHDRASGEGVGPQEYTLIRMELMKLPEALKSLEGNKVVMLAATLRPETMYGQTNCWVLPHEKDGSEVWYGVYRTHVENEVAIVSHHAARNMAFQGLTPAFGEASPAAVMEVKGRDLVGLPLKAPLTSLCPIYTLPLLTISMRKGTGVVTSVPSDAPDDYMGLMDLKNKPALREKYGVTDDMVMPFEIIPIIEIPYRLDQAQEGSEPTMTDIAAKVACEEYKVASQNDKDKLALAKAKTYKIGFYEGKMTVGDYKGMSVQDAKPKVKEWMLATGQAYAYAEPEKEVMSRSGNECVVALTDQWYIKYGEDEWKAQVQKHLEGGLNCYSEDTKLRFEVALGWLSEWGCSRSFGLGTLLPWDKQFVIESLSDSTIYMAFYTVCHILQNSIDGPFDGSVPGEGNVMPAQMTEEVWDYIMLDGPLPQSTGIGKDVLEKMKREFNYWYPVDLRVSGKDLIQNHLTFFLYNHAAIFPEKHWPRAMRTNGHVMLNNEKMSKSTGNFKTLKQAIGEYSADGMRFALALSGDGNEDANFEHDVANAAILKLTNELAFIEKTLADFDNMRSGPIELFVDKNFENEINRYVLSCENCYDRMQYREAMIEGWDKLQNARDKYRAMSGPVGLHRDLIKKFIECQTVIMAPFIPHYSEHVYNSLLGHTEGIMKARWPTVGSVDPLLIRMNTYFDKTLSDLRSKIEKARAKKTVTAMTIFVAEEFLDWQQAALGALKATVEGGGDVTGKDFKKGFMSLPSMVPFKAQSKVLMPFAAFTIDDFLVRGIEAFELKVPYDEKQILTNSLEYMKGELNVKEIVLAQWPPPPEMAAATKNLQPATPGKPACTFSE